MPALAALGCALAAVTATPAQAGHDRGAVGGFRPVASFDVPDGGGAEIVAATPDGRTLAYTDAAGGRLGLVDVTDPSAPQALGFVALGGSPTSVAVTPDGALALVAVTGDVCDAASPGRLVAVDLATRTLRPDAVTLGHWPDSVTLASVGGRLVASVAIENEEPEDVDDCAAGAPPNVPGLVQVVDLETADLAASTVHDVPLVDAATAAGLLDPTDPEPEFVDVRHGRLAVTLQENDGVATIDLPKALAGQGAAAIDRVWSSGAVGDRAADLVEDDRIAFTDTFPADVLDEEPNAGARGSDGIGWTSDGRLVTADEGEADLTGGRGFSWWTAGGTLLGDDGGEIERLAVRHGHYDDGRSENKGIEIEGLEIGRFGGDEFAFLASERGSFLAIYRLQAGRRPAFVQLVPTGIEPEGVLALPARGLVVTADEGSGTLTLFAAQRRPYTAPSSQPTLLGRVDDPFAALSGLAADRRSSHVLYAVPDDAAPSAVYEIDLRGGTARIGTRHPITRDGVAQRYDLEGIAIDTSIARCAGQAWWRRLCLLLDRPAFWVAQEGNAAFDAATYRPNALLQVDHRGRVQREVVLPPAVDSPTGGLVRANGFEGVTVSSNGRYLLAPVQREYASDAPADGRDYTRIARYDLVTGTWAFFLYPLDAPTSGVADDWIGLSEIVNLGRDTYAVIERDKQIAGRATIKRVTTFRLDGVAPFGPGAITAADDLTGTVIAKTLLADVLPAFAPYEKVEGLARTRRGELWAALDNDGGLIGPRLVRIG